MPVSFKDDYVRMDEEFGDCMYKMLGPTLLGYPVDVDASRLYMNTSETKQSLTLLEPDIPRLQTSYENVYGRISKAYKQLEGEWEVKAIIPKFRDFSIYMIVLYNKDKDLWDMYERPIAENLTEKFGYVYNTEFIDNLQVGDVVTDPILYKSTSFDKHMNYRYGKNAKVYYTTSNQTIEDALLIRKGWADGVKSVEIDTVTVPVNTNHIFLNLYGDDDNFIPWPKLGDPIKDGTICATRNINKNHMMIDFQSKNLQKIYNTDTQYYVTSDSYIYDIDIYYNGKEDFPDTIFFKQLKEYYDDICVYADNVYRYAAFIKESGSNYSANVPHYKSKYADYNNTEKPWVGKEKGKPHGYMKIDFKVKSIVGLDSGSKVAGRYGDKGVISKIVDDEQVRKQVAEMDSIIDSLFGREISEEERAELAAKIQIVPDSMMPYTDEFPVDILLNSSGAIRRLNSGQIYELDLNFIADRIRKRVCELKTLEEKEDLIFEFLGMINQDEHDFFFDMYKGFDTIVTASNGKKVRLVDEQAKRDFIRDIEENGFYIIKEPDSDVRYTTVKELYDRFDFIKPLPMYIDIFGCKKRRILKDGIVADKYMMILKHNNNKNFSARSTYRVNRANLPAKDTAKRTNHAAYSHNPVRIGEAYNLMSAFSGSILAEYNLFMRSSAIARKDMKSILEATGNPLAIKRLTVKDNYVNANADIFACKLKSIGLGLEFVREDEEEPAVLEDVVMPLHFGKYTVYDSPLNKKTYRKLFDLFGVKMNEISFVETYIGEKIDYIWNGIFEMKEVIDMKLPDEVKELVISATKPFEDLSSQVADIKRKDKKDGTTETLPVQDGDTPKRKRGRKTKTSTDIGD